MDRNPFALYIHIPFCTSKCPYCDFNSYEWEKFSESRTTLEQRYVQSLLKELAHYSSSADWNQRRISTIFFGGGTPSLLSSDSILAILNSIREQFVLAPDAEITLEANPGSVSEKLAVDRLAGFREAGVNRISFGVQSFNPEKLKFLGRLHTPEDTLGAVDNIKLAGFKNFNIDLIFGCAGETAQSWLNDLERAITLNPNHLSCYSLTIEPGTVFGKLHQLGNLPTLDETTSAELFSLTCETLAQSDYNRYEISNFAKPDFECRHNINYWQGNDYLGLGAGAHSFCGPNRRWINLPGPIHYIDSVNESGHAATRCEEVDRTQRGIELLLLSLRTANGVDLTRFEDETGSSLTLAQKSAVERLQSQSLVEFAAIANRPHLKLTEKGFLFADEILKALA